MFKQLLIARFRADVVGSHGDAAVHPRHATGTLTIKPSCLGCQLCSRACPSKALVVEPGPDAWLVFHPERCVGCVLCIDICSEESLAFKPSKEGFFLRPDTSEVRLARMNQDKA